MIIIIEHKGTHCLSYDFIQNPPERPFSLTEESTWSGKRGLHINPANGHDDSINRPDIVGVAMPWKGPNVLNTY